MTSLTPLQTAVLFDTAGLAAGFFLDRAFGDPAGRLHPVCFIGRFVSFLENKVFLRRGAALADAQKFRRGVCAVVLVLLLTGLVTAALLTWAILLHPLLGLLIGALLSDAALAAGDLKTESMRVHDALVSARRAAAEAGRETPDLTEARRLLARIVGRDTERLDEAGIARAAVETVAENASDGVVAPLFYLCLGGPVLALLYKAVNTMDSMTGYRNERYLYYGRAAARTDDVCNFLPARCTGLYLCAAAFLLRMDHRAAARVMERDARKSESPNAGWPEAAAAGALGVRLLGDASYFGEVKHKEMIGDAAREIEPADIARANRLMLTAGALAFADALLFRVAVFFLAGALG